MNPNLLEDLPGTGASWSFWTPMPSLAPGFSTEGPVLILSGNGNRNCFGAWRRSVAVEPKKRYRLRVSFRCEGIEDLFLHVTPHIVWRRGEMPEERCAEDAIRNYRSGEVCEKCGAAMAERGGSGERFLACSAFPTCRHTRPAPGGGARIVGEDTFTAPANCDGAEIRLLLRYAPEGRVRFEEVDLRETGPQEPRRMRVGTMRYRPPTTESLADHVRLYGEQIDRIGLEKPDLVLLPEFANMAAVPQRRGRDLWEIAEAIPGPFCAMLADKAQVYCCYVCAGMLERDGEFIYNTAVLYDRQGHLVGTQRKVHPYWPEEPMGVCPGETFEVFRTDFGTVGIMICYDSWWPESARLLALKGAEMILFPNAGYEEKILPARAIDNNVYLVAATLNSAAAIVSPRGELLAVSAVNNTLTAEIDLNDRPKCHPNAGGNLNPGPGGARWARNANSTRIYEEILAQVRGGRDGVAIDLQVIPRTVRVKGPEFACVSRLP